MRPLGYFCGGTLIGTCGVALTTLTLSAEAILLSVSSTRKNFSASMQLVSYTSGRRLDGEAVGDQHAAVELL